MLLYHVFGPGRPNGDGTPTLYHVEQARGHTESVLGVVHGVQAAERCIPCI